MICRIFTSKTFKLGDVGRELGWHWRPTNIMMYRVIYQLVKIGKTEAYHIGEQRISRGSVRCGPTSGIPNIRSGVTTSIRSCTIHGEGDRGRTGGGMRRRTQ